MPFFKGLEDSYNPRFETICKQEEKYYDRRKRERAKLPTKIVVNTLSGPREVDRKEHRFEERKRSSPFAMLRKVERARKRREKETAKLVKVQTLFGTQMMDRHALRQIERIGKRKKNRDTD